MVDDIIRGLKDREEIKEVLARYAHGIALGDGISVAELFTEDAVFSTCFVNGVDAPELPKTLRGRSEIDAFYKSLSPHEALPCVHNHIIDLAGDRATCRSTLEVRISLKNTSMTGAGYYDDELRREDGRWKFSSRSCTFFHFVPHTRGWAEAG